MPIRESTVEKGDKALAQRAPMLGLHLPGRRYEVFDLEECFLPSPRFAEAVRRVREWARGEGLTVYHSKSREGFLKNLLIREGKNTGEWMMNLVTSEEDFPERTKENFVKIFGKGDEDSPTSLLHTRVQQGKGRTTVFKTEVLAGAPVIHEELRVDEHRSLRFEISAEAFFQPNTLQAQMLYRSALRAAGLTGQEIVYDLYCGTGTIGLFCAQAAKHVYAVELNAAAVENGRKNAAYNGISNITFVAGDAGRFVRETFEGGLEPLPHGIPRPDVVMLDPPRAGLQGDAPHHVLQLEAAKIVYVSCNPATLARDLRTFADAGYQLAHVQPVDMFPHTPHIETVALLTS